MDLRKLVPERVELVQDEIQRQAFETLGRKMNYRVRSVSAQVNNQLLFKQGHTPWNSLTG
jgi:hypothetical protein